jgi:glycerol-3-phosphate dehydrogenase
VTTTNAIAASDRAKALDRLERETFDCLVVGGGITGAGIAREAALRGLSVALLEAEDYASGTSSRSSKLIHGGLRYLAMGDVALVRQTALERKKIHRLAPHLAEPRWLVVPARSRAGLLKLRAAITAYEKLGAVEERDRHRNWGRSELEDLEPILERRRFGYACVYREYLTDDSRLVLATLRAAAGAGAALLNLARVDRILQEGERATGVEARCGESGRRFRVHARCVINAAGPWVDAVRGLEEPGASPLLHLSKGIHVVLPASRLPARHMLILNTGDRRSIFVIPRHGVVYVGTTDTSYEGGHDLWPAIDGEDVSYLLDTLNANLAIDPVRADEVIAAWAGLRPLIAEPGKAPHEISRRDEVLVGPSGVVTIAGGKLTGFRPMAQETLEKAAQVSGLRLPPPPSELSPLPGGDFDGDLAALAARLVAEYRLPAETADRLALCYGAESPQLADRGTEPLLPGSSILAAEVDWAVEVEGARRLEDVHYRRTRAALYHPEARVAGLAASAARMAVLLGWDDVRREAEIAGVLQRLAADLAFRAEVAAA